MRLSQRIPTSRLVLPRKRCVVLCHLTSIDFWGIAFGGQVEHTRDVMSEVEAVSQQYEGLAVSCSQLYFALETFREVHFLYQFSLKFFQDILAQVRHRDTYCQYIRYFDRKVPKLFGIRMVGILQPFIDIFPIESFVC